MRSKTQSIKKSILALVMLFAGLVGWQIEASAQTTNYPQLHWKLKNPGVATVNGNSSKGLIDFVTDVDGDGVSDVVYATGASDTTVYLYSGKQKELSGNLIGQPHQIWKKQVSTLALNTKVNAIAAHQDVNNSSNNGVPDGKQEILVAYTNNTGNGNELISMLDGATGTILKSYNAGIAYLIMFLKSIPDVNNDHIKDIVASVRTSGTANIIVLDGSTLTPIWTYTYNSNYTEIRDIAIVDDVGGPNNIPDGIPDVVATTGGGDSKKLLILSGAGAPGASGSTVSLLLNSRTSTNGLVDSIKQMNGLAQDILFMSNDTSPTTVSLARIKGGDLNNNEWKTIGLASDYQLMKAASDINGDAMQDILLGYSNSLKMVSGTNGSTLWEKTNFPMTLPPYGGPAYDYSADTVLDLNGDQVDDVAALKNTSPTTVYLLKGQDGSDIWNYPLDNFLTKSSRVFAKTDLDGDQIPDVVVAGDNGDLYVIASKQGSSGGGGKYNLDQP